MRGEFSEPDRTDDVNPNRTDDVNPNRTDDVNPEEGAVDDERSIDDALPPEVVESESERVLYVGIESEPIETVLEELDALDTEESLEVVSPMALVPLYDRLDDLDLQYEAIRTGADDWRIWIAGESTDARCGERLRRPRRNRLPPADEDRLRRTMPDPR